MSLDYTQHGVRLRNIRFSMFQARINWVLIPPATMASNMRNINAQRPGRVRVYFPMLRAYRRTLK